MNSTHKTDSSSTGFSESRGGTYQTQRKSASDIGSIVQRRDSATGAIVFANKVNSSTGKSYGIKVHVVIRDNTHATTISRANSMLSGDKD